MSTGILGLPAIITCAVIGGDAESRNPHQPRTFDDIVSESIGACEAGAAVLHIHARSKDGAITQDANVYAAIAEEIRARVPDVILNFTTGGSEGMSDDERLLPLQVRPELASLDCGSMNFGEHEVFVCSQAFIRRAADEMRTHGVRPELECFDAGMIGTTLRLRDEGLIEDPPLVQFVLGVMGGAPARLDTLHHFVTLLAEGTVWAGFGIGRDHFPIMAGVIALGGHIRTGLEDVAYVAHGEFAQSNAQLVERAANLTRTIGRPVATVAQAREILHLAS